jgi:hypothetical protein
MVSVAHHKRGGEAKLEEKRNVILIETVDELVEVERTWELTFLAFLSVSLR